MTAAIRSREDVPQFTNGGQYRA